MLKKILNLCPYIMLSMLFYGFFTIAVYMESPDLCIVFTIFLVIFIIAILIDKIKNH